MCGFVGFCSSSDPLGKDSSIQIINKMNQEFAISLDLKETLNTALKIIITRLNAQAANVFLINNKTKKI